ncbi:MAG: MBL fold metallo-hydrolase [Candidatus Limnocylindria bacterium]
MEVLPTLHAVQLIGSTGYLICEDAITLVDAGHRGSARRLARYLDGLGRSIDEVTRIICTHGHPDHVGGAHEIAAASVARCSSTLPTASG